MHRSLPRSRLAGLSLAALISMTGSGASHEFWIEPDIGWINVGDQVSLDLRIGEMMKGQSYPFLSNKFVRFTVEGPHDRQSVGGNEGDIPSSIQTPTESGLHIFVYHAKPETVTFEEFDLFSEYLLEEGLESVIASHRRRELPYEGFTEAYSRNAKALVQVGPVTSRDRDAYTDLPYELVAGENPYDQHLTSLPVTLLWQGDPAADSQIAVIQRLPADEVERRIYRTDQLGRATIDLTGGGQFLLSSVRMEEASGAEGHVWESTWASLWFDRSRTTASAPADGRARGD